MKKPTFPGFTAERAVDGPSAHYRCVGIASGHTGLAFASGRPAHAGLSVVPAGCLGSLAWEVAACGAAAAEGGLNPWADVACFAATLAAFEDCS
jgi:Fungal calcium binding protein